MILLDTNVLSELIRPEPDEGVTGWLDSLDAAAVATTAITAAELLYGAARLPAGRRKKRLSEAIRGLIEEDLDGRVEPFEATEATHYATLVSDREATGRPRQSATSSGQRSPRATPATSRTPESISSTRGSSMGGLYSVPAHAAAPAGDQATHPRRYRCEP
jgi:predicted nucleic acid-binding protein